MTSSSHEGVTGIMKKRMWFYTSMLFLVVCVSLNALGTSFGQDVHTETRYFSTVLTSTITETEETTVTIYVTRTSTVQTIVETEGTTMIRMTVYVPYYTVAPIHGNYAHVTTVLTFVPVVTYSPSTFASLMTSFYTTTETVTGWTTDMILKTRTSTSTMILEEVYTSVAPTGFNIGTLSNNIVWILGATIIVLLVVIAVRAKRPRAQVFAPTSQPRYCVNCGSTIPVDVRYCPRCGSAQS